MVTGSKTIEKLLLAMIPWEKTLPLHRLKKKLPSLKSSLRPWTIPEALAKVWRLVWSINLGFGFTVRKVRSIAFRRCITLGGLHLAEMDENKDFLQKTAKKNFLERHDSGSTVFRCASISWKGFSVSESASHRVSHNFSVRYSDIKITNFTNQLVSLVVNQPNHETTRQQDNETKDKKYKKDKKTKKHKDNFTTLKLLNLKILQPLR